MSSVYVVRSVALDAMDSFKKSVPHKFLYVYTSNPKSKKATLFIQVENGRDTEKLKASGYEVALSPLQDVPAKQEISVSESIKEDPLFMKFLETQKKPQPIPVDTSVSLADELQSLLVKSLLDRKHSQSFEQRGKTKQKPVGKEKSTNEKEEKKEKEGKRKKKKKDSKNSVPSTADVVEPSNNPREPITEEKNRVSHRSMKSVKIIRRTGNETNKTIDT
jgi:hypothetical protein